MLLFVRAGIAGSVLFLLAASSSLWAQTGTLYGVGANAGGQLGDGTGAGLGLPVFVSNGVKQAAIGRVSVHLLRTDGTLWSTGPEINGTDWVHMASDVSQVSTSWQHVGLVKTDGSLWIFGAGMPGVFLTPDIRESPVPVQVATGVRMVSCNGQTTAFIRTDNTLWASGSNLYGQLGDGTNINRETPVLVASDVTHVVSSEISMYFVKADGSLWATGANWFGQFGDGTTVDKNSPIQIAHDVQTMSASAAHLAFIKKNGTLWMVGSNDMGQLGDGTFTSRPRPFQVATDVTWVALGQKHSVFGKKDGTVWAMGTNGEYELGDGTTLPRPTPVSVLVGVSGGAAGASGTVFLMDDARALVSGTSIRNFIPGLPRYRTDWVRMANAVTSVSAAGSHTLFVTRDETLWGTGMDSIGVLGLGSGRTYAHPMAVAQQVQMVSTNSLHTLFVKSDRTLWGMGANAFNQILPGSRDLLRTPAKIADNVIHASAGDAHSTFVKADGTLWGMGANLSGAIIHGVNAPWEVATPVQLATDVAWAVAANQRTHFVKKDGSLWSMGNGSFGQLGTESSAGIPPTLVANNVKAVAAGLVATWFLTTDGRLWGMGMKVGDGTEAARYNPVVIATGVVSIAASPTISHLVFSKDDGTVWTFGQNSSGQLGTGNTTPSLHPVKVGEGAIGVGAGEETSFVIRKPDTQLLNISTRSYVAQGSDVMIAGFVIVGTQPKQLLIRASGPALAPLGVSGVLADPKLELYSQASSALVAENDDWEATTDAVALAKRVGAFAWQSGSRDAALVANLEPGAYTVVVAGKPGQSGNALVEVYDASPESSSKLVNISTRSLVRTGDQSQIAGFYVSGSEKKRLLIRAAGPALAALGVQGVLSDPGLEIVSQSDASRVATNDNWAEGDLQPAAMTELFARAGAFAWTPGSKDAACVVEVAPGAYTAVVRGKGQETGVALIEVYDLE